MHLVSQLSLIMRINPIPNGPFQGYSRMGGGGQKARKTTFFEGWSWFKFNNLGLALGMTLKFYANVAKGLKLKVTKF